ncbi:MAG: ATP-binding protein [Patescibacteria group bacterium]|jgi:signal transduction histidine kinase
MFGLIVTILSVISTIALAGIVLSNNRRSALHVFMFLLSLGLAGSIGSNYFTTYYTDGSHVLLWIRWTMFFAALAIPSWYLFLRNFPKHTLVIPQRTVVIVVISTLAVMLLAISPWMFTSVTITDGNVSPQPGFGLPIFFLAFIIYLILLGKEFIHKFRSYKGVERAQLIYILIATIVSFAIIIMFNVFAPLVFHSSTLVPLTNIAPLLFTIIVAYAIVKHRLMDIRIIAKRAGVYVASIIVVLLIALLLYRLETAYFKENIPPGSWGPIVLLFSLIIYNPIKRYLEHIANKYFFTSLYNYQATLEELGKRLTFTINLSEIVDSIIKTIKSTMHLDRAGVLLYDEHSSNYKIYRTEGFTESNGISLVRNNFLTSYLVQTRKPVLYQELEQLKENGNGDKGEIAKLKTNMQRIEAHICLPLLVKDKLIGIIVLGQKVNKDAYTKEDLRLLEAVANQASIAVENARLYDEIQEFSKTLEARVEEQTGEIKEKNLRLQQLLKMKSDFLSIASHQLRTPLTAIRGLLAMQAEGDLDKLPKSEQKKEQQHMLESANRLSNIVNDLLDAMELEGGHLNFQFKEVDITEILNQIAEDLKPNYDKKGIALTIDIPKDFPTIEAEPKMLHEALENIIDNAEKYTNKGGVTVTLSKKNKHMTIEVKDTGIGIPKTDKPRLFEKFSRGEKSSYQHTDGSGLGLFITKNVITEHHGDITVESEGEGKGTTVTITLPTIQPKRNEK